MESIEGFPFVFGPFIFPSACPFNFTLAYPVTGVGFTAPTDGTITFDWSYTAGLDDSPGFDPFFRTSGPLIIGGFINIEETISDDFGPQAQSSSYTLDVVAGEVVTFGLVSDGVFCGADLTISNFAFTEPDIPPPAPVLISGPASGTSLSYEGSPYTVVYELQTTDDGELVVLDECSFDITILEFPTPITSLICNDLVNVSLDESCELFLNADQILEGGPYHCYDDYLVQVDRTLPLGNGPWQPGVLGPSDVHHVYAVRVVDDVDGDGFADPGENTCWGNINVEDKLPPVITCPCPEDAPLFLSFSGDGLTLLGDPQFIRPDGDGTACGPDAFESGPQFYNTFTFEVKSAGTYTIAANSGDDTYGLLYDGPFNPNSPCTNFLIGNDDGDAGFDFSITTVLAPGTYTLVVTSYTTGDNIAPFTIETDVPSECTFFCADKAGILSGQIATPAPVVTDNCSTPTLVKKDVFVEGEETCDNDYIYRTWTATDAWGNSAQCTQVFTLLNYDLEDVFLPEDLTINCEGCGITASTSPCQTGVPEVGGNDADGVYQIIQYNGNCQVISEGLCNLGAQYHDTKIDVCAGTFKILRHWTVLDWCTNTVLEGDQLIKVVDNVGPVITPVPDMTVSTNPSQCCATVNLPNTIIEDACSGTAASISAMVTVYDQYLPGQVVATYNLNNLNQFFLSNFPGNNFWDCDTLGNFGNTPCLPIGHHQVMYIAEDVCGNTSTESFLLTVVDDVPPVATCTEFTTVAIGVDDPTDCYEPNGDCEFAGVTWVPATAFDQGSHDNCSPIEFTIRRMKEADVSYSDCIDNLGSLVQRLRIHQYRDSRK